MLRYCTSEETDDSDSGVKILFSFCASFFHVYRLIASQLGAMAAAVDESEVGIGRFGSLECFYLLILSFMTSIPCFGNCLKMPV